MKSQLAAGRDFLTGVELRLQARCVRGRWVQRITSKTDATSWDGIQTVCRLHARHGLLRWSSVELVRGITGIPVVTGWVAHLLAVLLHRAHTQVSPTHCCCPRRAPGWACITTQCRCLEEKPANLLPWRRHRLYKVLKPARRGSRAGAGTWCEVPAARLVLQSERCYHLSPSAVCDLRLQHWTCARTLFAASI